MSRGAEYADRVTAAPEGRKLLRLEVRNAETPIERKPRWIKTTAHMGPNYKDLQQIVTTGDLHTVCQEAGCPNIYECWEDREATFLIGGELSYVLNQDIYYCVLTAARVLRGLCENVRGALSVVQPRVEILTAENIH